jgi:hypothetical protein
MSGLGPSHLVVDGIELSLTGFAEGLTREELLRELKEHAKDAPGTGARLESPWVGEPALSLSFGTTVKRPLLVCGSAHCFSAARAVLM